MIYADKYPHKNGHYKVVENTIHLYKVPTEVDQE